MFLQNKAVKKYLINKLGFTQTELTLINTGYYNELPDIILNETLLYLEKKEDQKTIDNLYQYLSNSDSPNYAKKFTDTIERLYHETPEIRHEIQNRLSELDNDLMDALTNNMTTKDLIQFLEDGAQELKTLNKKINKLKTQKK